MTQLLSASEHLLKVKDMCKGDAKCIKKYSGGVTRKYYRRRQMSALGKKQGPIRVRCKSGYKMSPRNGKCYKKRSIRKRGGESAFLSGSEHLLKVQDLCKGDAKCIKKYSGGVSRKSYRRQRMSALGKKQGPIRAVCKRGYKMSPRNGYCYKKKRSSKRRSMKKSGGAKRRSSKRRSMKKSGGAKRRSSKRRSMKKSGGAKRRVSKKRSMKKRSSKRRVSKKRSMKKRSSKRRVSKKRSMKKRSRCKKGYRKSPVNGKCYRKRVCKFSKKRSSKK